MRKKRKGKKWIKVRNMVEFRLIATLWLAHVHDVSGSKGETKRIKVVASVLADWKDPLFPLCVPERKKEKFACGFIIARTWPRYLCTFYRCKFIGPRYFFMVQVVRPHLCKHYESKSPRYERKTVGEKGERVTISPSAFFPFFLTI